MRFLIDAQSPVRLASRLVELGHDVAEVADVELDVRPLDADERIEPVGFTPGKPAADRRTPAEVSCLTLGRRPARLAAA